MASVNVVLLSVTLFIGTAIPFISSATTPATSDSAPTPAPAPNNNNTVFNKVTLGSLAVAVLSVALSVLPKVKKFVKRENLKIVSIANLIRCRRNTDKLVERASAAWIPTTWGSFVAHCYRSVLDGIEHVAMVKGEIGNGKDILVRVHSECLTGDIFGSAKCDCGNQLALAMQQIEEAGRGVLVYLKGHEGRGIGLGNKLRAYNLQDDGRDTVEANEELGLPVDSREYDIGAQILRDLGVRTMKLMTNNPAKSIGLKGHGLEVAGRVPLLTPITKHNKRYLETKRTRMGHIYGLGNIGVPTLNTQNDEPTVENPVVNGET